MAFPRTVSRWLLPVALTILPLTLGWCEDVPQIGRGPAAAWVEPIPVDLTALKKRSDVDSGRNPLLLEQQVNVAEEAHYTHFVTQLLTEKAVQEGARISVTFDPGYEKLAFNQLLIHRKGQTFDRLATQEIKVLQRESRLDWNLYDGRLSGVIILEDVRVGDVLEYAYTLRGRNPIFNGRFMDSFDTNWSDPSHHFRYRLLWPSNRHLAFKSYGRTLVPVVTPHEGVTEYVWEERDVPALISDREVPSWFEAWGWVQLSEFESWGEVAKWALEIHGVPATVPEELEKELQQIRALESEPERILAALRYVQDNIRYLGVEAGENSHKPYPVETILARRFGDCKDKARLLCAMLQRLGFEAFPALVETDDRQAIADWLPTALAFDHVVVQLRYHGKEYWLDPTNRDQGGSLETIFFPAYGQALVIAPGTAALTAVHPGGFEETSVEAVETFDFKDFGGAATLRVRTTWHGHEADAIRAELADTSLESIQKSNLNYYARLYSNIEAMEPPTFHDDRARNVIVGDEAYRLTGFWTQDEDTKETSSGTFRSETIDALLHQPATRMRTMPYALRFPKKATQDIVINAPWELKWKKEQTSIDDPAFKFTYSAVPNGARLTLHHSYESKADHVPAASISKYVASVDKARALLSYDLSIPSKWVSSKASSKPVSPSWSMTPDGGETAESPGETAAGLLVCGLLAGTVAVGYWWRRANAAPRIPARTANPLHRCVVCGETEESNPALEFRVASNGDDYCHKHLPAKPAASA